MKPRRVRLGKSTVVPYYTDVEEMLEKHKDIDVVDICAGDYEHHVVAKIAAEHKMHPIVEKPMAPTLAFCDVIINSCKKNGVHFEVAENYFRMPNDRILIKLITEGVLGDIMRVHFIEPSGRGRQFVHGSGEAAREYPALSRRLAPTPVSVSTWEYIGCRSFGFMPRASRNG